MSLDQSLSSRLQSKTVSDQPPRWVPVRGLDFQLQALAFMSRTAAKLVAAAIYLYLDLSVITLYQAQLPQILPSLNFQKTWDSFCNFLGTRSSLTSAKTSIAPHTSSIYSP